MIHTHDGDPSSSGSGRFPQIHTHPQDLHIMSLTSLAVMNQISALPVLITIVGTGIDKLHPVIHIHRVGTG
jgi:hypothetical protein